MGIEDAFLHEILAHPDDDAPRLIYADWLDEHNDPRGEFIRIQCALAQFSDEDPRRWPLELREQELLREHQTKWMPAAILGDPPFSFHRGFIEEITISPEDFHLHADRFFEQMPIRSLHLYGPDRTRMPDFSRPLSTYVAPSRHLAQIRKLSLSDLILNRSDLHEFLASPALGQLTELQLSRLAVDNDGQPAPHPHALPMEIVHDLTRLPCRTNLETLQLIDKALTLDGLRFLANSTSLVRLHELNLNGNRLTHQAARVLAEGRLLSQLEMLSLDSNLLGDAGALAVRNWPPLPRLARLSLGQNQIFAAGVKALAEAPALRELASLDLSRNISCDAGAAALSASGWTRLQAIYLWFNGIGDRGVRALARSKTLSQLTRLNLTANCITDAGARALIRSPGLSHLVRLDLLRNGIEETERQRLRDRFGAFAYC